MSGREKLRKPRGMAKWEDFGIVGTSPALREALAKSESIADGDVPVLLVGKSGTGKKTLARAIAAVGTGTRQRKDTLQ